MFNCLVWATALGFDFVVGISSFGVLFKVFVGLFGLI